MISQISSAASQLLNIFVKASSMSDRFLLASIVEYNFIPGLHLDQYLVT